MNTIGIGAVLTTAMEELTDPRTPGVAEAAVAVEERGLESLWVADLVLGDGTPTLEPALAAAAGRLRGRAREQDFIAEARTLLPRWTAAPGGAVRHPRQGRSVPGTESRRWTRSIPEPCPAAWHRGGS